jgi:hypothetical protein
MLQFSLLGGGLGAITVSSKIREIQQGTEAGGAITQSMQTPTVEAYGHKAALVIITKVRALPEDMRIDFLKRVLDAIDSTLWTRVNAAATSYQRTVGDPILAYLAALSQNLSNELVLRLSVLGASGTGVSGLGELQIATQTQAVMPNTPAPGTCTADSKYIWDRGGFWRRIRVGESCQLVSSQTLNVGTGQGGVAIVPTTMVQVGPFSFPASRSREAIWGYDDYAQLSAEQADFIGKALQKKLPESGGNWTVNRQPPEADPEPGSTSTIATYQSGQPTGTVVRATWPAVAPWGGPWLTHGGWLRRMGIVQGVGYDERYLGFDRSKYAPIAQFKNPVNGEQWGLWVRLAFVGPSISAASATVSSADGTTSAIDYSTRSVALQFMTAKMPDTSWLGSAWNFVVDSIVAPLVTKFYDFVIDIGKDLASLMCAIAANPASAVTTATASGGPAAGGAVAAGALIIGSRCKTPEPPPEPLPDIPPEPKSGVPWGPIAAGVLTVGGILAFAFAPKKPAQR